MAVSVNEYRCQGRVGKDPIIKYTRNEMKMAKFSIVTSSRYMNKQGEWVDGKPYWHNFVAFAEHADAAEAHIRKGKQLWAIKAEHSPSEYTDREGNKRMGDGFIVRGLAYGDAKKDFKELDWGYMYGARDEEEYDDGDDDDEEPPF